MPTSTVKSFSAISRCFALSVAFSLCSLFCVPVLGEDSAAKPFDLPAGRADNTLKIFSEQSGFGIVAATDVVEGVRTNAVQGRFLPREALDLMLAGTGLIAAEDQQAGAFSLRRMARPPASTAAGPVPAPAPEKMAAPTNPALQSAPLEEVVKLSPFVVESTEGENTYTAESTLAGTRVRTDLKDVAASISVVTKQFLQDTAVRNAQDLLVYTPSTEVAGIGGNFSGSAGLKTYNESSTLINPSTNNRVRGLDAADMTRDYFLSDIPWDSFNVGRIDLQRGPNSILFGVGSPAGIINASINDASYKTAYKIENVVDEYGSFRSMADFNQVLLPNQLAVRVSLLDDRKKFQQTPAFNNQSRLYAALRYDPEIFGKRNRTTIRIRFEDGTVKSNNPRILPPNDQITPWFSSPYDKQTINTLTPGNGAQSTTSPVVALYVPNGVFATQGRAVADDVRSYYNGASSSGVIPVASGTPTKVIVGLINSGLPGLNKAAYRPLTVPTYSNYALANLEGGSFYVDKVLTDPTVFDFFNNLLDGPNKREWQKWNALNADLTQTFFNDRLAVDLTYDRQTYNSGQIPWLSGPYYAIGVEVNEVLVDGSANPDLGRPYVASSDAFGNYSFKTDRESERAIVTADLRAEDYFGKNWVSYILGRSVFTGLASEEKKETRTISWAQHATTPEIVDTIYKGINSGSEQVNSITGVRQYDWLYYLGPSLSSQSSAAGANASRILMRLDPGASTAVRYFNTTWNKGTNPDPAAPYDFVDFNTGLTVTKAQSDNPANYVGWTTGPVSWLSADNPTDFPSLVTGGERTKFKDRSQGFTWQGYLLDGDLVATFGWRKDTVTNYQNTAPLTPITGLAALDYEINPDTRREATGQSRNWSGVYHLPKKLTSKLPWGTSISLLYNESSNFKADAPRRNLVGNIIPNPQGKTREKGFVITTFNDRLSLRAIWYKTQVSNATLGAGGTAIFGSGSGSMYNLNVLGYIMAAMVQDQLNGILVDSGPHPRPPTEFSWDRTLSELGFTNYASRDGVVGVRYWDSYANTTSDSPYQTAPQTIQAKKMVDAWLNTPAIMTKDFFAFWNSPIALDPSLAKASGNLHSAFGGTNPYSDFLSLLTALNPSGSNLPVTTVDTLAEGQEFELTFKPVKNWNISVNYVRTFATRTNLDQTTRAYMDEFNTFYNGDAGTLRLWGQQAPSFQVKSMWNNDLWLPYQVALASQGQSSPEVAPWRLNGITTYTFDRGRLKGAFIGGAARLEAGRISGYRYSSALGFLDVNQPLKSPSDEHFDLWVGYTYKLTHNVNWRIQLNLRNVGEKTRLVPAYYEPDGSLALARIQQGMEWLVTNTFEF
ncbi:MAG: TonB-dependent receptor plug domain-containing protein [Opitutaceae bacterium]|nr:TonB-dependent receptor plug domain-containing protein [Opitutaceae bacterium]